jgi:hypothetical protein
MLTKGATMTRRTPLGATLAALALAGTATAAEAPVVSAQQTSAATTAPLTIPGTGVQRGERLPRGARLVFRTVTLADDQTVTFTIKAPQGKVLRGLVPEADKGIGFVVTSKGSYAGRRSVTLQAYTESDGEHVGRIYALVR